MKKTFYLSLFLASFLLSNAQEKSLIDFFQPMEPVAPLVGGEHAWGSSVVLPRDTANGLEDPYLLKSNYWDGGVIHADDGRYYLYASRWSQTVSHKDGWTRNSMACLTVSDNVMGPYREERLLWPDWTPEYLEEKERKDYALPGWGHNVFGFRMHDGRYGVVSSEITPGEVFACETPNGDFEYLGRIKVDYNGFEPGLAAYGWNNHMANVMILPRPDGKYMILSRNMVPMISESGVTGPYKIMNFPVFSQRLDLYQTGNEDPTVWYSGGLYHVVYNNYGHTDVCHHFTSKDGITDWRYRGVAFDKDQLKIFKYTDGTINDWQVVQRPTAVMHRDGYVSHFLFSVMESKGGDQGNDNNGSKIVVVPFDGRAFDAYMAELVANDPAEEYHPVDVSNAPDDPNVLNSLVYSFEKIGVNVAGMWHLQHKENFIPVTDKVLDGEYAMKYTLNDPSVTTSLQIQGSYTSNLIKPVIEDGVYDFSVNFWADAQSPDKVEFPFIAENKYFSVIFDISEIEKGKWVKLTKSVEISGLKDGYCEINITVRNGQQGTVYMDKIELVKTGNVEKKDGWGLPSQMGFEVEDSDFDGADGWFSPQSSAENWFRTNEQACTGDYSLCCKVPLTDGDYDPWIQTDDKDNDNACRISELGDYHMQYDLFLAPDANEGLTHIYSNTTTGGWNSRSFAGINTLEKGKWHVVTLDKMTIGAASTGKTTFKINKDAAKEDDVLFYIDNFRVVNAKDMTSASGVETKACEVLGREGKVQISGARLGASITLYDMGGMAMCSVVATASEMYLPSGPGLFLVSVDDVVLKVRVL